jgi:hypothetical protein
VQSIEARGYNESTKVVDWAVRECLAGEPSVVYGDPIGWGWGVIGEIGRKVAGMHIDVVPVNVSERAYDEDRFFRLRDELWWRMREVFERGEISIPNDPILKGDLNAPRYDDNTGRIKVESKLDLKKRGVESPNRADALMMTMRYDTGSVRRMYAPRPQAKKRRATRSWRTI